MKVVEPKGVKENRVRVLIQPLTKVGKPVGSKSGFSKNKQISLYDTSVEEAYRICLQALRSFERGEFIE